MKKAIVLIISAALLFSCGTGKNVDSAKAILGDWEIVQAGGQDVDGGFDKPTISFSEDGKVNGNTSINYFFGDYSLNSDTLSFGEIALTKMMGPTPEVENAVLEGLDTGVKISFEDNDNASILAEDGTLILKLKRIELKKEETSEECVSCCDSTSAE